MKKLLVLLLFLLAVIYTHAQINGVVTDVNKLGIPGINVIVESLGTGAATDIDGKFKITEIQPGEYTLKFSGIGMKTQYRVVQLSKGIQAKVSIVMEENAELLDEVVVVGYGVQRKREVTGTIARVESKKLIELPVPSFEAALQGNASGVQVTQGSGVSGASSLIRVRGIASISSGGDPLYVIDGIPITQNQFINESGGDRGAMNYNPLSFINPNDIESVEILKDASATGIYGSRGANGVILITTKRGTNKELKFDFMSRAGVATAVALPNMLNSEQYLQIYQEAWENDGNTGLAPLPGGISWENARNTNTDWVDETTRVGIKHLYSLSASKGGDKLSYFVNGTYDNNSSYLKGNNLEKISLRANIDYKINEKISLGVTSGNSFVENNRIDAGWSGGLGYAMSTALPIYPIYYQDTVYNDDGSVKHFPGDYFQDGSNPVRDRELKKRKVFEQRSVNTAYFQIEPKENLYIKASGGFEYGDINDSKWESPQLAVNDSGKFDRWRTFIKNYKYTVTANYLKDIGESHQFNFLLGHEYQRTHIRDFNRFRLRKVGAPLWEEKIDWNDRVWREIIKRKPDEEAAFLSYFGRVNYMFKKKYIAQVTGRVDGSSKFGGNNKFGFFPSLSFGWIMTEEKFMSSISKLNHLKLKASYGITGNSNIPNYQAYGTYTLSTNASQYNGQPMIYPTKLANPDLKWETSTAFDAGFEYGLFDDRVSGQFNYYHKVTNDVLLSLQTPKNYGFSSIWDNVGSIMNWGVEFNMKSRNLVGKLQWTTDFNISYNYNEITSIGDYTEDAVSGGTNDTRVVVGMPVGTNFLVRYSHVDPSNGRPVYLDINGNETYDWNPKDRVPVGDILPNMVGGLTNSFKYEKWDFSFLFYYSFGGKIYDSSSKRQLGVVTDWNMRTEIFDRWRKDGDDAYYPRLTKNTQTYGSGTPWINTDMWLKDGDYIRLRNISFGYTFDPISLKEKKINNLRLAASATNLWTWTNFDGLDPEIVRDFENQTDRNMSGNITYLTAPTEKTINLTVTMSF